MSISQQLFGYLSSYLSSFLEQAHILSSPQMQSVPVFLPSHFAAYLRLAGFQTIKGKVYKVRAQEEQKRETGKRGKNQYSLDYISRHESSHV